MNEEIAKMPRMVLHPKVVAEIVTITPETAEIWLGSNHGNRKVRPAGVESYKRDMDTTDWKVNGDTIKFDLYGDLLDGQHRLYACILSGKSFESLVVWGLEPDSRDTMDSGLTRNLRDQLKLSPIAVYSKYASTTSALVRRIHLFTEKNEQIAFARGDYRLTTTELSRTLDAHPEIAECVLFTEQLNPKFGVKSTMSFVYWLLREANPELAVEFMRLVSSGAGLHERHPILTLRRRITRETNTRSHRNIHVEPLTIWLSVVAWNLWMAGDSASKIQVPQGGMKPGNFPAVREMPSRRFTL